MATETTKSTADLVKEAFEDARELIRAEVKLATDEAKTNMQQTKAAMVIFGAAGVIGIVGLTLLAVAIPLAFDHPAIASLVTGGIFVVVAGAVALSGYFLFPKKPLELTRKTAKHELHELEEAM